MNVNEDEDTEEDDGEEEDAENEDQFMEDDDEEEDEDETSGEEVNRGGRGQWSRALSMILRVTVSFQRSQLYPCSLSRSRWNAANSCSP